MAYTLIDLHNDIWLELLSDVCPDHDTPVECEQMGCEFYKSSNSSDFNMRECWDVGGGDCDTCSRESECVELRNEIPF